MANPGDAPVETVTQGAGYPGGDVAESPPPSADLLQHEKHGVGLLQSQAVRLQDNDTVGELANRVDGKCLMKSLALQRCETESAPVRVPAQGKRHSTMAKAAVPVVEDQRMSSLHRTSVLGL